MGGAARGGSTEKEPEAAARIDSRRPAAAGAETGAAALEASIPSKLFTAVVEPSTEARRDRTRASGRKAVPPCVEAARRSSVGAEPSPRRTEAAGPAHGGADPRRVGDLGEDEGEMALSEGMRKALGEAFGEGLGEGLGEALRLRKRLGSEHFQGERARVRRRHSVVIALQEIEGFVQ